MNALYIVRHGRAVEPGTPGIADDDRPLTKVGERRVRQVARGLERLGVVVDRIATSPLPRAHRTAEIIADRLGDGGLIEVVDDLRAHRTAASIRAWLLTRGEDRLMIVGHNPSLTDLVGRLVTGSDHPTICPLRKGAVAALRIGPDGSHAVDWIARPRLFRR